VTETFLAGFMVIIPALTGRPVWQPRLLAAMPWLVSGGLVIFGACGMLAGLQGVPRRTFNIAYDGMAPSGWHGLMLGLGLGAVVFAFGLAVQLFGVLLALIGRPQGLQGAQGASTWPDGLPAEFGSRAAWTGPIAIMVLLLLMTGATIGTFEVLHSLPLTAAGGHAGH
jgi:cytochrome c oxidase subunit 1